MPSSSERPHIAVVGTTASGKSALALGLARADPSFEIVSVDSMQVYRGMDIGTAKPSSVERAEVPHHLIDIADPAEEFTVTRFKDAFGDALAGIEGRGHRALLVGGTGLYVRAVVDDLAVPPRYPSVRQALEVEADAEGGLQRLHGRLRVLDPEAADRMEPSNRRRVVRALEVTIGSGRPFSSFGPGLDAYPPTPYRLVGLARSPDDTRRRIAERFRAQLDAGLLAETEALARRPAGLSRTARQALGYRELLCHIEQREPLDDCIDLAIRRIQQYARRQRAWFRRDPRITWFQLDGDTHSGISSLDVLGAGQT